MSSQFVELTPDELQDCEGGIFPIVWFIGGVVFYYGLFGNPRPAY